MTGRPQERQPGGRPLTSTEPGATVRETGSGSTGRYQIDGNPTWRDITGTAITTTTSPPFTVEERTSRLVSDLCTDKPKPPDC